MTKPSLIDSTTTYPTLRAWMKRTGTTQEHIASLLGISEASMSRRMDGTKSFEWTEATRLSLITGVPVTELLPPDQAADFLKLLGNQPTSESQNRPDNDDVA